MNYKSFKILLISILTLPLFSGCLFEEDVPDPIPYESELIKIDKNKPETFNGNYKALEYHIKNVKTDVLDIYTLQGSFNINKGKTYNYFLKYNGYDTKTMDYYKQIDYINMPEYTIGKDGYTIVFKQPIKVQFDNNEYSVTSIKKTSNFYRNYSNTSTISDLNAQYYLCDPKVVGSNNSCSSINGALKYIGHYKIETITCNNIQYVGGKDFAGEMTAAPTINTDNGALQVAIPITIKVQVSNTSALKDCMLTQNETNNKNLYYKKTNFLLSGSQISPLNNAFTNVGLIGLKDETDEYIRTTEINYEPKDEKNFADVLFGNNNKVTMRLRLTNQGDLNNPPAELNNQPYTQNP